MVRLVFRPYTQFRRSICTSESLRTSIRVSPDFVLTRHSSPSFGSQRVRSGCASSRDESETPRECGARPITGPSSLGPREADLHFHYAFRFSAIPMTRAHARLLGPCFKTGPESTQSYSAVDWRKTGSVRGPRRQQSHGPGSGTRSGFRVYRARLRRAGRENSRPRAICLPSVVPAGTPRVPTCALTLVGATSRTLDRRPTGHDVLQEEKCTRPMQDGCERRGQRRNVDRRADAARS